jgi:hypothetical protein
MKASIRLVFFLILIIGAINAMAQNGSEGKKSFSLQLGASGGFFPNLSQPVVIPMFGVDMALGKFGFRANGQIFNTKPDFDFNTYLKPILSEVTLTNVQENNSNVFLSLAPYYGFGNKSFTLQAGLGLKYLMQKAASTKADYTAKPTTIMLDYSVPQAKTSLFLIEPNLRTVFGKRGNPLRFYLEAGYIMPSGKTEFNYTTRGDLTTLIDSKTGLLNTKYLDASKAVTQTGNFMKGFMTVGAGILWNLSPDKKLTENAQMPTVNNYGVNDDGIKRTVPKDDKPHNY